MQECAYCWRKFKSNLKKCPYCGKEAEKPKKEEGFFKQFRKKRNNQ